MSLSGKRKVNSSTAGFGGNFASAGGGGGGGALDGIVSDLSAAIRSGHGTSVCNALILPEDSLDWLTVNTAANCPNLKTMKGIDFSDVLRSHLQAVAHRRMGNYSDAFKCDMSALKVLIKAYKDVDDRTLLDMSIYRLIGLCSHSAKMADAETVGQCLREMQEIYRQTTRDVKKYTYYLALINAIASLPGSESFCRPLFSDSDTFNRPDNLWSKGSTNYKIYPVGHVATFAFYCGRAKLLEDNFETAVYWLNMAYKYSSVKNRGRVLSFLIPAQMCLGVMPSEEIATKFGHHILYEVSLKVRQGDVHGFEKLLYQHQRAFIKVGIYLALERLKFLVYRNLFKRLQDALAGSLNLYLESTLLPILHDLGLEGMDLSELECILSNLIFHKAIKGNLQFTASGRVLVLSPKNTFPAENLKNIAT